MSHFDYKIIWDELPLLEQYCMFLLQNKILDNCLTNVFRKTMQLSPFTALEER